MSVSLGRVGYPYSAGCYHCGGRWRAAGRTVVSVHKTLESARKAALKYAKRVGGDIPPYSDGTLSWFGIAWEDELFAYSGELLVVPCPLGRQDHYYHWRPAQLLA